MVFGSIAESTSVFALLLSLQCSVSQGVHRWADSFSSCPSLINSKNLGLTMIQLGFPTAHRLTFLSSPPVTKTLPDLCPRARQLTADVCATISSVDKKYSD